jgi:S1-C subfamily serine protease
LGIAATNIRVPRQLIVEHDLLSDTGVEVIELEQGGDAERNGIVTGDVIVSINDRIVSTVDDIHRLMTTLPMEIPLSVSIIRGTRKLERTVLAK